MWHLRDPLADFFKEDVFANFQKALDGEMKRIRTTGAGTKKKKAKLITPDEEEYL